MQPATFKSLELYHLSKKLVIACYELTHDMPVDEKSNIGKYIRTAVLSVHINLAQAAFATSKKKKKKAIATVRNALVVLNAATDILLEVQLANQYQVDMINALASDCGQRLDQL